MSRLLINRLFISVSWISLGFCCLVLIFLFTVIAWNGIRAVNFDFLMTESRSFGAVGGIYYQIFGSILMVIVTAMISLPLALGTAIYKSEYLKNSSMHKWSDIMIYGLNGIPSIIFGVFGLIFFVNILNTGISWFVGSVILSFMILPTIVLASFQSINSIPGHYRESALAQQATDPQALQNAWGASFVLICLVTLFSTAALFIRKRNQIVSER